MIENQLHGLGPKNLRIALSIGIVVIIIIAGVGFWFFQSSLAQYARKVSEDRQTAESSSKDLTTLQKLKTQLEEDSVAVNRAEKIVAETTYYKYQNQVIEDINAYAKLASITIEGYAFDSGNQSAGGTAASGSPAAVPSAQAIAGAPKTTSISVSVKNPVSYKSLLQFIHSLEANLTKMQLTGVSITKGEGGDGVSVSPLTIEVYIQ